MGALFLLPPAAPLSSDPARASDGLLAPSEPESDTSRPFDLCGSDAVVTTQASPRVGTERAGGGERCSIADGGQMSQSADVMCRSAVVYTRRAEMMLLFPAPGDAGMSRTR